jgi:hypothetical protein
MAGSYRSSKRRQRAFKITGLTWIVERSFAWLGRIRVSLEGMPVRREIPPNESPGPTFRTLKSMPIVTVLLLFLTDVFIRLRAY